jgi:hypothetical protein
MWLSSSPDGSSQQLQSDWNVRNGLSHFTERPLKDEALGVPPTAEEQKALASMTQDQKCAIARLNLMDPWLKQQSAEMQQQVQFQQVLQVPEKLRRNASKRSCFATSRCAAPVLHSLSKSVTVTSHRNCTAGNSC